ncbi:VOC family protein [Streptomyces sp. NPDC058695]|uniref:VOC family protein n=1 Tax=Streptomyces sp. NPDC058695 TaxID=3346604 RepID=UPI00365BE9A5
MLTTRFVDGSPNWLDLGTPDLDAAVSFYTGLFDWQFQSGGPEVGGYGLFQLDGKTAAGGMTVTPDQAPPSWTVYFQTQDADATVKAAERAGGSAPFQPMDVTDLGRMAIIADPAGATFGLWQPGQNKGLGLATEDGSLNWIELYTPDVELAKDFYGSVLGWGTFDVPFPGGTYVTVNPAGTGEDDMFGGMVTLGDDPAESDIGAHWSPYFHVPDVDAIAARAQELGGKVRFAPTNLPGVGRIAKLTDPQGARFAVIKGDPNQT